jgi:RimJ/RimL family protein N-acetyltransferase
MIAVRRAESEAEFELWTRIRNLVEVGNPTTVEELRQGIRRQPETRHWLAEEDGEAIGCAFVSASSVPGRAFVLPRVVRRSRGRGAGTALLAAGLEYAATLGCERARSHVDGADDRSLRFAARHGFEEVDRQVELVRRLTAGESSGTTVSGIELEELGRDDVEQLRDVVVAGVQDMPVAGGLGDGFAAELLEEYAGSLYTVVAREGERVVGAAALLPYGARDDALEHAFTTVLRSHRGRGIAQALKAACVHWAAAHGYAELVTWTQSGNDAMQAVNVAAGFRPGQVSITVEGPLP